MHSCNGASRSKWRQARYARKLARVDTRCTDNFNYLAASNKIHQSDTRANNYPAAPVIHDLQTSYWRRTSCTLYQR